MPKQTGGRAAFQANIEAMRELGRQARQGRAQRAEANTVTHLATMTARGVAAGVVKATRAAQGVSRRDDHNAQLKAERLEREERLAAMKASTAGDRTMRALAALA